MTATTVSRASLPRGAGRDAAAPVGGPRGLLAPAGAARTRRVPAVVPLVLLLAVHAATLTAAALAAFPTS